MQRGLPMQPTVVLLKEGTDTSQGTPQLLSNISACLAISETLASTLGPRGMDKLIVNERGEAQISNDGATILKLLDIVHPAARTLVDIARAQDAEVGDGTTSVVLLAAQFLKEVRGYIEEGVSPHIIMKGFRKASQLAIERIKEIQVTIEKSDPEKFRSLLLKCASTSMSSKLIHSEKSFFSNMVVDAVQCLDQDDLDESLIGVKKIAGGGMQDSLLVKGVAFKKTFTYAGAEQQPKSFKNPLILCLNVELELKAEKDNAEVRVEAVSEYQAIVDAEWEIIYRKLEAIEKTGAKVVLSKLPIGDLATQYFADRDIFCAGRVAAGDLRRVVQAVGGSIQSTCSDITREHLGTCGHFEERQIGGERYNIFEDCPKAKTCTLVLRGGAEQFIEEVERSLHDAIMVVKRAVRNGDVVAGGGAIEMDLSAHVRKHALSIPGKLQLIMTAFAKALEIIPRQICDNAGLDSTDILNKLRMKHSEGEKWFGVDVDGASGVRDNMDAFVWEPALVKLNAISSATEAACLILSVDETVRNPQSEQVPRHRLEQHSEHCVEGDEGNAEYDASSVEKGELNTGPVDKPPLGTPIDTSGGLFKRLKKSNLDLDSVATQPSVFDDPTTAEIYRPPPQYENAHRFDPDARWTWREEKTKTWFRPSGWFTEREEVILVNRVLRDDPSKSDMHNREGLSIRMIWEALIDWRLWPIYVLGLLHMIPVGPPQSYLTLSLRNLGFTTTQTNLLVVPSTAIGTLMLLFAAYFSEIFDSRVAATMILQIWALPLLIALYTFDKSTSQWAYFAGN
ncbi:hypothetical protein D9758_000534 [Tetrapyrgos nigripes]|uniref:T-complex protein 1 subunit eta n=1 Tax=Tetrapyrgos nigripes TaxID=182062 RepID=A0A8H5H1E6_9AGAR|nr:hypothetical protein D9758_000534 [Tetrapyrgos nigripes]